MQAALQEWGFSLLDFGSQCRAHGAQEGGREQPGGRFNEGGGTKPVVGFCGGNLRLLP